MILACICYYHKWLDHILYADCRDDLTSESQVHLVYRSTPPTKFPAPAEVMKGQEHWEHLKRDVPVWRENRYSWCSVKKIWGIQYRFITNWQCVGQSQENIDENLANKSTMRETSDSPVPDFRPTPSLFCGQQDPGNKKRKFMQIMKHTVGTIINYTVGIVIDQYHWNRN